MYNDSSKNKASDKMKDDAMKIARGTQRPAQTKEQTKLIAQGIQKGIGQYKNQLNVKSRALDKKQKKATGSNTANEPLTDSIPESVEVKRSNLAWVLLILSWLGFAAYIAFIK
ncbi:MAG: hypothetical protein ACI88A_003298 [Paraglaciecola sp.]|jgi:hypothetical protein